MTSPTFLNRDELVELAALDAFGLLDEFEAAQYNRSFHNASAAVQDEIIEFQAELVTDGLFLADAEPPNDLRQRVIDVVSSAIERDNAKLAPIAKIGRGSHDGQHQRRLSLGASGQFWRAAAFVLAGVLIVGLYFGTQLVRRTNHLMDVAINLLGQEQVKELLAREADDNSLYPDLMDVVDNPNWVPFALGPADGGGGAVAVVYIHSDTNEALLYTHGLPPSDYTLTARGGDSVLHTRDFKQRGPIGAFQLGELSASLVANLTWEVTDLALGTIVLRSA